MKLTKETIEVIEREFVADKANDRIVFDDKVKGFGLRLQGDTRTWIVQYRTNTGQRRFKLGTYPELSPDKARKAAVKAKAQVQTGDDPQHKKQRERESAKVTLRFVAESYLKLKKPKLRSNSYAEIERYLLGNKTQKYWKPLHGLPVEKIERRIVAVSLREIAETNGPIAAARARIALSSMFTWAMKEGFCETNPVTLTNDPAEGTKPRERVLNDAELVKVWNACRDDDYGRIVRLLILTGQRRNEVGDMTWHELDQNNGKWRIPGSRTKNHRDHELSLPAAAWAIIAKVPRRADSEYLFGRKDGFTSYSVPKLELDERCQMPPWVIRDLRRTVATRIADLGIAPPHVIEALLNHSSGHKRGVAGIYNRSSYEREVGNALAAWADHVRSIIEGTEPTVVPLRGKPIPA